MSSDKPAVLDSNLLTLLEDSVSESGSFFELDSEELEPRTPCESSPKLATMELVESEELVSRCLTLLIIIHAQNVY